MCKQLVREWKPFANGAPGFMDKFHATVFNIIQHFNPKPTTTIENEILFLQYCLVTARPDIYNDIISIDKM